MGTSGWELFSHSHAHRRSSDASLFSSSLPVLANKSLNHYDLKHDLHSMHDTSPSLNDIDQELDRNKFLPDDEDELLAGIMDGFEASWLPNLVDDLEECDVFGSGGGLELESDPQENLRVSLSNVSLSDESFGNGVAHFNQTSVGTIVGEHPLGEHPSRTLFVRNINSNVEDAEIRTLFELYGDIRTMYTACKHRGFVMISYYDIRAARTAMRALQNKPLRRRKLDIHFSIPKENPSDKDINQGTLVVFNLDQSVSNDNLLQIFGAYGEVKEIRETPHKRYHKFIEFYDVRAAESALKSLNKSDIAGKRIKVEHSRPGGARRSNLLHLNHELEKDEWTSHKVGSLPHFGSLNDRNPLQSFSISPGLSSLSASANSSLSPHTFEMSHSLPEHKMSLFTGSDPFIGSSTFNGSSNYWGNSELYSEPTNSSLITQATRHSFVSSRNNGFPIPNLLGNFSNWSQIGQQYPHYQPGSAPSTIPLKQNIAYFRESPGVSFLGPGCERITRSYRGELSSHDISNAAHVAYSGYFPGPAPSNFEALAERGIEVDIKKQFQLDLDKIRSGDDIRTTLMIKNIPNKYTSKMLMAAIDEHHKGTYDFLYLPIDFKNKCNVGYAFINLLSPLNIIPFYKAFYGKKWEKFNSEKVATLAYARIQGKAALISHFQHTSLMNEDKRCRPILLDSEFDDKIFQENVRVDQPNGSNPGNLPRKMWMNDVDDQEKR